MRRAFALDGKRPGLQDSAVRPNFKALDAPCVPKAPVPIHREASVKDIAGRALDTARSRGASYADTRINEERMQFVEVKNGRVTAIADTSSMGLGVRVLV